MIVSNLYTRIQMKMIRFPNVSCLKMMIQAHLHADFS